MIKHHADGTPYARPYLGINAVTKAPMRPYKRFPEAANDEEAQEMAQEWVNTIAAAAEDVYKRQLLRIERGNFRLYVIKIKAFSDR